MSTRTPARRETAVVLVILVLLSALSVMALARSIQLTDSGDSWGPAVFGAAIALAFATLTFAAVLGRHRLARRAQHSAILAASPDAIVFDSRMLQSVNHLLRRARIADVVSSAPPTISADAHGVSLWAGGAFSSEEVFRLDTPVIAGVYAGTAKNGLRTYPAVCIEVGTTSGPLVVPFPVARAGSILGRRARASVVSELADRIAVRLGVDVLQPERMTAALMLPREKAKAAAR